MAHNPNEHDNDGPEPRGDTHTYAATTASSSPRAFGFLGIGAVVVLLIVAVLWLMGPGEEPVTVPAETNSIEVTPDADGTGADVEQEPGAAIEGGSGN